MKFTILLADDDTNLLRVTEYQLEDAGFNVLTASDGESAYNLYHSQSADLVLTDLNMPGMDGLELIKKIRITDTRTPIIVITAYGSIDNAIKSTQYGADDYITKPFSFEALKFSIDKNLQIKKISTENENLKQRLSDKYTPENMIGQSPGMKAVFEMVDKVSNSDANVIILGESGTGKELVARAIHNKSPRSGHPFVAVNCASIPHNLMESELFGHVRGAFTGAIKDTMGKFEAANRGTLFLDEIGDLDIDLQSKLLRVLQDREIQRIGDAQTRKIDVRILSATHRNLDDMVAGGEFRQDLFFRLNVVPLTIPPLRERKEDIPLLIHHFIQGLEPSKKITISDQAIKGLVNYQWPGNIRELENLMERFSILFPGKEIQTGQIPFIAKRYRSDENSITIPFTDDGIALDEIEKMIIIEALKRNDNNQTKTASFLKIPRHVLIYRIKKLNIK